MTVQICIKCISNNNKDDDDDNETRFTTLILRQTLGESVPDSPKNLVALFAAMYVYIRCL